MGVVVLLDGLTQLVRLLLWWLGIMALASLGFAALLVGGLASLTDPRLSNCLYYVVNRWRSEGGFVIVEWSRYIPGCLHFSWTKDFRSGLTFSPPAKHPRRLPPLVFRGTIQEFAMPVHAKHDQHAKKVKDAVAAASGPQAKILAAADQTIANIKEIVDDMTAEFRKDLEANLPSLLK